ncbi:hypothetical protein GGI35DRAFT_421706 [Trichoderma velutinum]
MGSASVRLGLEQRKLGVLAPLSAIERMLIVDEMLNSRVDAAGAGCGCDFIYCCMNGRLSWCPIPAQRLTRHFCQMGEFFRLPTFGFWTNHMCLLLVNVLVVFGNRCAAKAIRVRRFRSKCLLHCTKGQTGSQASTFVTIRKFSLFLLPAYTYEPKT